MARLMIPDPIPGSKISVGPRARQKSAFRLPRHPRKILPVTPSFCRATESGGDVASGPAPDYCLYPAPRPLLHTMLGPAAIAALRIVQEFHDQGHRQVLQWHKGIWIHHAGRWQQGGVRSYRDRDLFRRWSLEGRPA